MSISTEQNKPENLKLLVAQATLYKKAKRNQSLRIFVSIGLATISPFLLLFFPNLKIIIATLSGVWLLISKIGLEPIEKSYSKQAAKIQEEFDINVFGLKWNPYICEDKIAPETIIDINNDTKINRDEKKDWYPNTDHIAYPNNVLFSQRTNLVWDWKLRRKYSRLILLLTIFIFCAGIIFSICTKQLMTDYLLAIFLPSLSAIIKGSELFIKHNEIAKKKENISIKVLEMLTNFKDKGESVDIDICRNVQDIIFLQRYGCPIIPDWYYRKNKDAYEETSVELAEFFIKGE